MYTTGQFLSVLLLCTVISVAVVASAFAATTFVRSGMARRLLTHKISFHPSRAISMRHRTI